MKKNILLFSIVLLTFILSNCDLPQQKIIYKTQNEESTTGTLTITIKNEIVDSCESAANPSRTAIPHNMYVSSYSIKGVELNKGATFEETCDETGILSITGIDIGEWRITVIAKNAEGIPLGDGETTVTVAAENNNTDASITVKSFEGKGALSIAVSWPESVENPILESTLSNLTTGAETVLNLLIDGNQASFTNEEIATGYYILTIKLNNGNSVAGGAREIVRIANEAVTTVNVVFEKVNPLNGSFTLKITSELDEPLEVAIIGAESIKPENFSLNLKAQVSNYSGNITYLWSVNAKTVGTGENFIMDSSWQQGTYRVDLIAFTEDGKHAGSATVDIDVVEFSIDNGFNIEAVDSVNNSTYNANNFKIGKGNFKIDDLIVKDAPENKDDIHENSTSYNYYNDYVLYYLKTGAASNYLRQLEEANVLTSSYNNDRLDLVYLDVWLDGFPGEQKIKCMVKVEMGNESNNPVLPALPEKANHWRCPLAQITRHQHDAYINADDIKDLRPLN